MRYISTRGSAPILTFEEAMLTGLARDGGLYVPESIPQMATAEIAALQGRSYEDIAFRVMRPFIGDTFSDAEFGDIIGRAYKVFRHAARAPLVQLESNHFLLELFHGPTLAFKDFGGRFMAQTLSRISEGKPVTILTATSGDTGAAVAHAFHGIDNINVLSFKLNIRRITLN